MSSNYFHKSKMFSLFCNVCGDEYLLDLPRDGIKSHSSSYLFCMICSEKWYKTRLRKMYLLGKIDFDWMCFIWQFWCIGNYSIGRWLSINTHLFIIFTMFSSLPRRFKISCDVKRSINFEHTQLYYSLTGQYYYMLQKIAALYW